MAISKIGAHNGNKGLARKGLGHNFPTRTAANPKLNQWMSMCLSAYSMRENAKKYKFSIYQHHLVIDIPRYPLIFWWWTMWLDRWFNAQWGEDPRLLWKKCRFWLFCPRYSHPVVSYTKIIEFVLYIYNYLYIYIHMFADVQHITSYQTGC